MLSGELCRVEADGDGADREIEGDDLFAAEVGVVVEDPRGRPEGGVTCERELFGGGEDANLDAAGLLCGRVAGEDKGGFGEIGFAGDALHLLGGEIASVVEDGECVTFERALGKNVDDGEGELARRHG